MSGVNASGPLIRRVTVTSSIAGTRRREFSVISSKRGQSSSSRRPLKSAGIAVELVLVERPRRAVALVAAHHEAGALLAEVHEQVRVAQRRQVLAGAALAERLRHQVLVGERDDRHAHAREAPDLRPRTCRRR